MLRRTQQHSESASDTGDGQPGTARRALMLGAILLAATLLRCWHLGRLSLWYDEVVPMRLARQATPAGVMRLLKEIEATRAPLHPLVLWAWLKLFGPSDFAGRALAAACGLVTVVLTYRIGRHTLGERPALWGAWLAAVCPPLVQYSQEVKMYSFLVMVTVLSWDLFFALWKSAPWWRCAAFGLVQAALIYSHPLGTLMAAAQGLTYLAVFGVGSFTRPPRGQPLPEERAEEINPSPLGEGGRRPGEGSSTGRPPHASGDDLPADPHPAAARPPSPRGEGKRLQPSELSDGGRRPALRPARWILIQLGVILAVLPWLGNYLDHEPEFLDPSGTSLRNLLALPIGFVGGNRWALAVCVALILFGTFHKSGPRWVIDRPAETTALGLWLVGPPLLLFAYSLVTHPLFGQARYTLYVAPAYLLLLGRGLARCPLPLAAPLAVVGAVLSGISLASTVYAPDLKADWRAAAELLRREAPGATVAVATDAPAHNVEFKTAEYYLGSKEFRVVPAESIRDVPADRPFVWAVGMRNGRPVAEGPSSIRRDGTVYDLAGLRLFVKARRQR